MHGTYGVKEGLDRTLHQAQTGIGGHKLDSSKATFLGVLEVPASAHSVLPRAIDVPQVFSIAFAAVVDHHQQDRLRTGLTQLRLRTTSSR